MGLELCVCWTETWWRTTVDLDHLSPDLEETGVVRGLVDTYR